MAVHQTDQSMTSFFIHVFNCIMSTAYHFKHYFLEDFNIELIKIVACLQPKNASLEEYRANHSDAFDNLMESCKWLCADDVFASLVKYQWDDILQYKFQIESDDVINFWAYMSSIKNEDGEGIIEQVATFALYILAIPHSNVFPERRFSDMNYRKTKTTNRLSIDTLNGRIMTAQAVKLLKMSSFEPTEEMKMKAACGRFYNNKYTE
ncbi:hypothetical protein TKK_0000433 [Trichogramma kaykai]